ncbi:MAG TPA: hypothetical protein VMX16_09780 [Terriglobia bacterium]|nr:hypothetical protein [Terriglobia bacterium]
MGILTETMTRLRDEIVSSRHARVALRGDLVHQTDERRSQVSALCTAFARDRAGAHRAWFGRTPAQREAAERERQRTMAELASAKPRAERQPSAAAEGEPQRHKTAEPVPAPAVPLPQAQRTPFKGSKKH